MTTEFNNAIMRLQCSEKLSNLPSEGSVLPPIEELLENHSKDEIIKFINELSKGFSKKYNENNITKLIPFMTNGKNLNTHMTYIEQQSLKPSVNDPDYKVNILLTNEFGVDMSTKEGSEMILSKEDTELMSNARLAEKKRIYRMIAKEEARLGLLPMSTKQMKNICSIQYIQEMEKRNQQNSKDLRYAVLCEIDISDIDENTTERMLKKTWVKEFNHFEKQVDNTYRLIVGYEYTKSDGIKCKRTMSMMKKELASCLKIDRNKITARVICKDEFDRITVKEVD